MLTSGALVVLDIRVVSSSDADDCRAVKFLLDSFVGLRSITCSSSHDDDEEETSDSDGDEW